MRSTDLARLEGGGIRWQFVTGRGSQSMLGFALDIYEATIMQLVTPLLIKEWGIAPATINLPVWSSLLSTLYKLINREAAYA
jgi:hypothetical protein